MASASLLQLMALASLLQLMALAKNGVNAEYCGSKSKPIFVYGGPNLFLLVKNNDDACQQILAL